MKHFSGFCGVFRRVKQKHSFFDGLAIAVRLRVSGAGTGFDLRL